MNSLDVNTERGQKSLVYERRAVATFERTYPYLKFYSTDKTGSAAIDGVLTKDGNVIAVVETKTRNMSLDQLISYNYEWLVTASKIERGILAGSLLGVPFIGFLYLIPDKLLLVETIANNGEIIPKHKMQRTTTQATINGGVANRNNMFIDMSSAKVLQDV